MTIRGTCEGCGKAYRVPAADRTYVCKACGGTIAADEEAFEEEAEPEPEHHETAREHRERLDRMHRAAGKKARLIWGGLVVVVAVAAVAAYQMTQ